MEGRGRFEPPRSCLGSVQLATSLTGARPALLMSRAIKSNQKQSEAIRSNQSGRKAGRPDERAEGQLRAVAEDLQTARKGVEGLRRAWRRAAPCRPPKQSEAIRSNQTGARSAEGQLRAVAEHLARGGRSNQLRAA